MSSCIIETQIAAIRIAEGGTGEPALVFLHYWGGSARTWQRVLDRLADQVHWVAVNQRGWGGSVATDGRYDLAAMADDVESVVRALDLGRYVLVGHSMGGKVAQIVATRRPRGLVGLVLVAPAPPTPMPVPEPSVPACWRPTARATVCFRPLRSRPGRHCQMNCASR